MYPTAGATADLISYYLNSWILNHLNFGKPMNEGDDKVKESNKRAVDR